MTSILKHLYQYSLTTSFATVSLNLIIMKMFFKQQMLQVCLLAASLEHLFIL